MSDYLTEEEQLDRLKRWWRENGTFLMVGTVLLVSGVAGWRWYQTADLADREAASDLYADYLAVGAEDRAALVEQVDAEIAGTSYHAFTLLHRANEAVRSGDIDAAIDALGRIVDADVREPLRDVARIRQARLHQQTGDSEAALAVLAEVRGEGFRWQVQELKGDIHLALGERGKAHEAYASALREAGDELTLPILEMKANDTAPVDAT